MKCDELLASLGDYVDGTVDPALCAEFEAHLAGCHPCKVVVDTLRMTVTLYREGQLYELPREFQARLHDALRRRWRQTHDRQDPAVRP